MTGAEKELLKAVLEITTMYAIKKLIDKIEIK